MRNSERRLSIPHSPFPIPHSERGIALLIVVSLLTVIGIMGVAFAFSMYLETQATRQFVATAQARYLAESGISHARVVLDEDRLGSRVDDPTEPWADAMTGSDVDVDGDGTRDAVWWVMQDANGRSVGRYALKIIDESGKANLNAAQAEPASQGAGTLDLTTLLERAGVEDAAEVARTIERYRYGEDGRPGQANIDDDRDGSIDEPDEYQPTALAGDDRRIDGLEELRVIAGLTAEDIKHLSRLATTYSWDLNASVTGKPRANVNALTAVELLPVLLEAGVGNPWQAAVNMADYADRDVEMSRVTKSSQELLMSNQGPLGDWVWSEEPEGHYGSDVAAGAPLSWTVPVPTGSFRLIARGLGGTAIGDITVNGQHRSSVNDGESLGQFQLSGTLTVSLADHEPTGTPCAFRGIELVSEATESGVVVRGIEAVRINELMVDPELRLEVSAASFEAQSSGWTCPPGTGACSNSGVGQGRWTWTNETLPPGHYYVRVFGTAAGQTVGEVRVGGATQLLVHEQTHPATIVVGSDGKVSLTIGKTAADGTYYLKGATLSLRPDAEYVELINLTGEAMDASGWTLEGELTGGRTARLPAGSVIRAHGVLVAAVDLDDTQLLLGGNGVEARSAWEIPADAPAVQLEFPNGPPAPGDGWLKTTLPSSGPTRLILRSQTVTVDEVEYPLPPPTAGTLQSLEKGDPTVIVDQDHDGVDEGWYVSLSRYTPGQENDNNGMRELVGLETITHDPAKEVTILSRPLAAVGELAGLPSGTAWKPFSSADLARIVDRLTVEGWRMEAEGHWVGDEAQHAWEEQAAGIYVHTDPALADVAGRWRWERVPEGTYRLSLYGCEGCLGEQMAVRWERSDGTSTNWSPALSTDVQGRLVVGQITIGLPAPRQRSVAGQVGGDETPPNALTLDVQCASPGGVCHFDYVRLDPRLVRVGPINVNTAPLEVLLTLPGMTEAKASQLIAGRPYGDQDGKGRGIGDILLGSALGSDEAETLATFRRIAHLLTTRSDVFQILSLGQALNGERVEASQRIQTIVQR